MKVVVRTIANMCGSFSDGNVMPEKVYYDLKKQGLV